MALADSSRGIHREFLQHIAMLILAAAAVAKKQSCCYADRCGRQLRAHRNRVAGLDSRPAEELFPFKIRQIFSKFAILL